MSFQEHAALLKLRCMSQLIDNADTAWMTMAGILIGDCLWSRPHKKERRLWTPSEEILLYVDLHTSSRTMNFMLESWGKVESHLQFDPTVDTIPPHLTVLQVLKLMEDVGAGGEWDREAIVAYTKA